MQDERLTELISGLLDDDLSAAEEAELKAGLAASAEARELHARMLEDQTALRALPALRAPENLKQRALLKLRFANADMGRPWQRGLLAAASVLLVVGLFSYFRPIRTLVHSQRLFLRAGQVATKAAEVSQELRLAASGGEASHVMVSDAMSGRYNGGPMRVVLQCDAGNQAGGSLAVTLAFDFDGDGHMDFHTEPRTLELDGRPGFEHVACVWPELEGMRDLANGRVQVQVATANASGPSLMVRLEPQQARLDLPFEPLEKTKGSAG